MARTPTGITGVTESAGFLTSVSAANGNRILVDYK
jgi:hypothetical protein